MQGKEISTAHIYIHTYIHLQHYYLYVYFFHSLVSSPAFLKTQTKPSHFYSFISTPLFFLSQFRALFSKHLVHLFYFRLKCQLSRFLLHHLYNVLLPCKTVPNVAFYLYFKEQDFQVLVFRSNSHKRVTRRDNEPVLVLNCALNFLQLGRELLEEER